MGPQLRMLRRHRNDARRTKEGLPDWRIVGHADTTPRLLNPRDEEVFVILRRSLDSDPR